MQTKVFLGLGIVTVAVTIGGLLFSGCSSRTPATSTYPTATPPVSSNSSSTTTTTTAATTTTTTSTTLASVSFSGDVFPILRAKCALCHMDGAALGDLRLDASTAYINTVNIASVQSPLKLIVAGLPDDSYLFHKVSSTQLQAGGSGTRMPPVTPLSASDIDLIKRWISQGALDN